MGDKMIVGKMDATEHKKTGESMGVSGFPTLVMFRSKVPVPNRARMAEP